MRLTVLLHEVADESALTQLSKQHSLRKNNMRHRVGLFEGNGEALQVGGWQPLEKVQWLQRMECSEYVPMLGGTDNVMKTRHAACTAIDMPFTRKKLNEHLAHAQRVMPYLHGAYSMRWYIVSRPSCIGKTTPARNAAAKTC